MMEEIVNEDFEKTSNSIKSPDEAVDAGKSDIWQIQSEWKFYRYD